jgi:guanine nucleotide-binding protein subunit beta-5
MASPDQLDSNESIDELTKEVEQLKQKLEEERAKFHDVELHVVAQKYEPIQSLQMKSRRVLKGHQGKVLALDWSSDKRHVVSSSQDGKLFIWDAFTTNKEHVITLPTTWIMCCAYSPSASYVACGGIDNKITIFKVTNEDDINKNKRVVANHTNYISACKFLHSDQQLLTACGDSTCRLWDVEASVAIQTFQGHQGDVLTLDVSPSESGNIFVSGVCLISLLT